MNWSQYKTRRKDNLNKRFEHGYGYTIKDSRTALVRPVGDTQKVAVFGLTGKLKIIVTLYV